MLEIGAGAGRFTQILAGLGVQVLVADLSQVQLDLNRRHAQQYGFAYAVEDWQQVDICERMPVATNQKITATGDISPKTSPERSDYMHLFRAGELREWLTKADLSILALSASSCLSIGWNDLLGEVRSDKEKWEELLRMELEACAEEGSLNMGTHIIAVAGRW